LVVVKNIGLNFQLSYEQFKFQYFNQHTL